MTNAIRLEILSSKNFSDFERLTAHGKDGGCYCAFWHQKFSSVEEWHEREHTAPEKNRDCMRQRVDSNFHVGVLAYEGDRLLAWISVSPVAEVYWAWRRTAMLGPEAKTVACITCITIATAARGQGLQGKLLRSLLEYGKAQGWTAIEGYPFDEEAVVRHKTDLHWPGLVRGFVEAGFEHAGSHWLSQTDCARSIYRKNI